MRYAIIENGAVANIIEAEPAFASSIGAIPAENAGIGWSYSNGVFATPVADIAMLKRAKNDEINSARLSASFNTFDHSGKAVSCDQLSRSDIDGTNGYVALNGTFPEAFPGAWKCADNTYLPVATIAEWKAFYGSMVAAGSALYAHSQALKSALADAATAEQIAAVVW